MWFQGMRYRGDGLPRTSCGFYRWFRLSWCRRTRTCWIWMYNRCHWNWMLYVYIFLSFLINMLLSWLDLFKTWISQINMHLNLFQWTGLSIKLFCQIMVRLSIPCLNASALSWQLLSMEWESLYNYPLLLIENAHLRSLFKLIFSTATKTKASASRTSSTKTSCQTDDVCKCQVF